MNQLLRTILVLLLLGFAGSSLQAAETKKAEPRRLHYSVYSSEKSEGKLVHASRLEIEVDFAGRRFRRGVTHTHKDSIDLNKDPSPWEELTEQRAKHLLTLIAMWRETNPPYQYRDTIQQLGKEGDYSEQIDIDGVTDHIRGFYKRGSIEPPRRTPPEWQALLAYLKAL
jgi:hypothetical protein